MATTVQRAGTEACPYEWLLEKRTACAPSEDHNLFGFPVQPDTAVHPYTETITKRHVQAESKPAHQAERGVCWRPEAPAPNQNQSFEKVSVPGGALVEAGRRYRAKPNGMDHRPVHQPNNLQGKVQRPTPTQNSKFYGLPPGAPNI